MTSIETTATVEFNKKRAKIIAELKKVTLPTDGSATQLCWTVALALNITAPTVKNYLQGDVKDGYLAEAILSEFKRLKILK